MDPYRGLEITTNVGCRVACRYCPQDVLRQSGISRAQRVLRFDDFSTICAKLPRPFRLHFTGFSEPFHNPRSADMIRLAADAGFDVKLSTTLSGFKLDDIDIFSRRMCFRIHLHLPSAEEHLMRLAVAEGYVTAVARVLETLGPQDLVLTFGSAFHGELRHLVQHHSSRVPTKIVDPEGHDWYVLVATPFNPSRGPFGPSAG